MQWIPTFYFVPHPTPPPFSPTQVFSGVILKVATDRYAEIVQSREYTSQHTSRTSDTRPKTWWELLFGLIVLPFKLAFSSIIQIIASLVSFQSALQFIMSGLRISSFTEAGGLHADSATCNQVVGAKNFDSLLAYLSTALAYVILPAAFYEMAKVICPRFSDAKGRDGLSEMEKNAHKHLTFSRDALKKFQGAGGRKATIRATMVPRSTVLPGKKSVHLPSSSADPEDGAGAGRDGEEAAEEDEASSESRRSDSDKAGGSAKEEEQGEGDVESPSPEPAHDASVSREPLSDETALPTDRDRMACIANDEEGAVNDNPQARCWQCNKADEEAKLLMLDSRRVDWLEGGLPHCESYCAKHKGDFRVPDPPKPPILSWGNFFWLVKLPSTLLAPDLILALVSSNFPSTLDGARPSQLPPKKPSAASSSSASNKSPAKVKGPGWLRARLIGLVHAARGLWTNAQVPLETFPRSWQEERDFLVFKHKVCKPEF